MRKLLSIIFCLSLAVLRVEAQSGDELDPFDDGFGAPSAEQSQDDASKTTEQLMREAISFWINERYVDARAKLLAALKKTPKNYRIHTLLARHYLANVGHFRLALQYVKQAQALFEEQHGKPPYRDLADKREDKELLYLLSQTRLNLDNYQGALDVLDQYTKRGYFDEWYPSSRAWILMKLGRLPEAIRVAQTGMLVISSNTEKGQILNMLGILYSMNGERPISIDIFKQAVALELSEGKSGQPATPLNNVGEVYKEMFEDDKAETSWLRATGMPDGCDHVLPALNLSLLYLDQLNLSGAKQAMDNFEACILQFPLRNGEEHRALVHLMRGRIALLCGDVDRAISHYESALVRKQWFGKIGTSEEDLQAAVMMSLGQAFRRKIARDSLLGGVDEKGIFARVSERLDLELRAWWYMRRSRQVLTEQLNSFEDISIRNTDSMLEYPTLGEVAAGMPSTVLERRIEKELLTDARSAARPYYDAYRAENLIHNGQDEQADKLITKSLTSLRPKYDNFLRLQLHLLELSYLDPNSPEYLSVTNLIFALSRPSLANYGYKLPVNFQVSEQAFLDIFKETPFKLDNSSSLKYLIRCSREKGEYVLQFSGQTGVLGDVKVKSSNLTEAVRKLINEVFVIDLSERTSR